MKLDERPTRPAECLLGLDLEGGWHVDSYVYRPPTSTGGKFSVGYLVVNKDKGKGYLKALDFSAAFQSPDPARALEELTKAYNFERDLLAQCKGQKLRRVVVPLADGWVKVPGNFGDLCNVAYLIFELATGDIRNEVANWQKFDLAWVLRSLHHSAVGLQQLHSLGIAHQDLKPSNVLVFPIEGSKISDLGRASHINIPSKVDNLPVPGDVGYAAPEQIYRYGWGSLPSFSLRCVADLYHLGSLIFFFFLNCSASTAINYKISEKHIKNFTRSDFVHDLPYIQNAFTEVLDELRESAEKLAGDLADELVMIAQQLCEPDPRRRGDPRVLSWAYVPQYDLQAYISRFDRLAKIAEMRMI